jgi:hypothetical protein
MTTEQIIPLLVSLLMAVGSFLYMHIFFATQTFHRFSFDSKFYVVDPFPSSAPYCYRWIPCYFFGKISDTDERIKWWKIASAASLILSAPILYLIFETLGLSSMQALLGVWFFVWLHGIFRVNVFFLLLIDQFQIFMLLLTTYCALQGWIAATIILSLISSGFGERAPVFSCIFSMSFWPIFGIFGHIIARKMITPAPVPEEPNQDFWWLKTSVWKVGHKKNHDKILDFKVMILPWGLCALLFPIGTYLYGLDNLNMLVSLIIALCVGYAQLLIATDRSRLYQWAFLPVLFFSVIAVPEWAYPIVYLIYPFYTSKNM